MSIKKLDIPFSKIAMFTDIHFGKHHSSAIHNNDCLNFIRWFCDRAIENKVDAIGFLGDWFETRSAINVATLNAGDAGMEMLSNLGIPVFFIVGNHDMHHRHSSKVYSTVSFRKFYNVHVINEPTYINDSLWLPYIFESEYDTFEKQIQNASTVYGHLEFKNFFVTGYNTLMNHGPDAERFNAPKKIFTGHFHKRQANRNVIYIGNTFGMDFGDSGDYERGMAIYDVKADDVQFINWDAVEAPKYLKVKLSDILNNNWDPKPGSKIRCIADVEISYTEAQQLKTEIVDLYALREFSLEEDRSAVKSIISGEDVTDELDEDTIDELQSIDELVVKNLESIPVDGSVKINRSKLIQIYTQLKLED